jgi:hypothetical protein
MQRILAWAKAHRLQAIFAGGAALLALCCASVICMTALFPSTPRPPTATPARLATLALPTDTAAPLNIATRPPTSISDPTSTSVPPTPTTEPTRTPIPTQAPTFTVVELRSPVPVNGEARLVIRTTPGANCFITYRTPAGNVSDAQGLENQTTDAEGLCAWTWQIGRSTTPGTGTLIVSVDGYTESLPIVIQ